MLDLGIAPEETSMATKYILEDVSVVDNNFAADSRDKSGVRVVSYDSKRSLKLHIAIDHIVQIEVVKDAKEEERSILTMTSGQRYVTRRGAGELCAEIEKTAA
jgi:hypothetical protein